MVLAFVLITSLGLVAVLLHALTRGPGGQEEALVDKAMAVLPGINCTGCGFDSCHAFAEAVVAARAPVTGCVPGGPKTAHGLADLTGADAQVPEPLIAAVHCKGGKAETVDRAIYDGPHDCRAGVVAGNGRQTCDYGCLGLGTCVKACPFDAITITANGVARVDPDKCTGCGACVESCPRSLIAMMPRLHKIFLGCSNHDEGSAVSSCCSVGCTACGLCVTATPSGAIEMVDHLPVLDYSTGEIFVAAANRCPSKCFVDLAKARPKANIDIKCDGCADCAAVCPVNAISGLQGERHVVDRILCIGCGKCVSVCHVRAITLWGGLGYRQQEVSVKSWRKRK